MKGRIIDAADLFCGSGGTSTGLMQTIEILGHTTRLVAVNHWAVAVATHSANHPAARHLCADIEQVRPEEAVPGGKLDLLLASPECVHFSRARGGKPVTNQRRAGAWWLLEWLSRLDVQVLLVENVKEFLQWGDLDDDGRPDKKKLGRIFLTWRNALMGLGYTVDWKILNAADYGDVTTRERLFVQARKDGKPIRWPVPSHSRRGTSDMFGTLPKWRAAREIIDWSDLGPSLLDRPKPLSLKTRLRIARGLQRFGGVLAPYYIRLLDLPSEDATRFGVTAADGPAEPFTFANRNNAVPVGADQPTPTFTTATGGGVYVVAPGAEPIVIGQQSDAAARPVEQPIPTVSTGGVIRMATPTVQPFLDLYYATGAADSVDEPLSTATTKPRHALVSPLVVKIDQGGQAGPGVRSADDPLATMVTKASIAIASPMAVIVPQFGERDGQRPRVHDLADPLPAVTSHGAGALATATIEQAIGDVDPRRLVWIDGVLHLLDIRFRMLKNSELAAAMGFPPDYQFSGTKTDITRQIGNAVCVNMAAALTHAILNDGARERRTA